MEGRRGRKCWSFTRRKKQEEAFFLQNGSMLLEKMLSFCNGKSTPIRNFSAKELIRATNNFDADLMIKEDGHYKLFKGSLGNYLVSVKMYDGDYMSLEKLKSIAIWDIVMTSQMSKHKYVLKLIGCCLEFEIPVAVFEYAGSLCLSDYFHFSGSLDDVNPELQWERRLRIANQIANVVVYLHTALPRTVIHRDLKPGEVIIDQFGVAKLSDLSLSIPIPDGETKVEDLPVGTFGFLDPEYMKTGFVSAKSDVYSFGMILLILLTGQKLFDKYRGVDVVFLQRSVKKHVEKGNWDDIVDPRLIRDGAGSNDLFQAILELTLKCIQENGDDRPDMIDVARELRKIEGVQKQIMQSIPIYI